MQESAADPFKKEAAPEAAPQVVYKDATRAAGDDAEVFEPMNSDSAAPGQGAGVKLLMQAGQDGKLQVELQLQGGAAAASKTVQLKVEEAALADGYVPGGYWLVCVQLFPAFITCFQTDQKSAYHVSDDVLPHPGILCIRQMCTQLDVYLHFCL